MNKNEESKKHEIAESDQEPSQPKRRNKKESKQEQPQQKELTRKKREEKEPAQESSQQKEHDKDKSKRKEHARKKREGKEPAPESSQQKEYDKDKFKRKERARKKRAQKKLVQENLQSPKGILQLSSRTSAEHSEKHIKFSKRKRTRYIEKEGLGIPFQENRPTPRTLMSDSDKSDLLNIRNAISRIQAKKAHITAALDSLSAEAIDKDTRDYLQDLQSRLSAVEEQFVKLKSKRILMSDKEREARIRLRDKRTLLSAEEKEKLHKEIEDENALYKEANILLRELSKAIFEQEDKDVEAAEEREEQAKGPIISRGNEIIEDGSRIIEKLAGNISRNDIPVAAAFEEILQNGFFLISHICEEIPLRSQQIIKDITLTSMLGGKDVKIPGKITLYLKNNDPNQILYARASNAFLRYMLEYSPNLTKQPYNLQIINEDGVLIPGDLLWASIRAQEEEEALAGNAAAISSSSSSDSSSQESDEEPDPDEGSSSSSAWQNDDEGASFLSSEWQEDDEGASSSSSVWQSSTPFYRAARSDPEEGKPQARNAPGYLGIPH